MLAECADQVEEQLSSGLCEGQIAKFVQDDEVHAGEIDPSFVITHRAGLEDGPDLYQKFRDKEDGCIKVVLTP